MEGGCRCIEGLCRQMQGGRRPVGREVPPSGQMGWHGEQPRGGGDSMGRGSGMRAEAGCKAGSSSSGPTLLGSC
eukprot:4787934-Prymnesium_polylepis.1